LAAAKHAEAAQLATAAHKAGSGKIDGTHYNELASNHSWQAGQASKVAGSIQKSSTRAATQERNIASTGKRPAGQIQTSAKGARYYVNVSGNKVYVK
jgi:hypothetical protein